MFARRGRGLQRSAGPEDQVQTGMALSQLSRAWRAGTVALIVVKLDSFFTGPSMGQRRQAISGSFSPHVLRGPSVTGPQHSTPESLRVGAGGDAVSEFPHEDAAKLLSHFSRVRLCRHGISS